MRACVCACVLEPDILNSSNHHHNTDEHDPHSTSDGISGWYVQIEEGSVLGLVGPSGAIAASDRESSDWVLRVSVAMP